MKFKKYATLILLTILVIGFSKNTVFAAAKAAGTSTKAAVNTQNKTSSKKSYKKSDLRLMASIINCEAGGESYQGKLAVGIVVMNRVSSKAFPNTIRKVIYQRGQFSPVRNGRRVFPAFAGTPYRVAPCRTDFRPKHAVTNLHFQKLLLHCNNKILITRKIHHSPNEQSRAISP